MTLPWTDETFGDIAEAVLAVGLRPSALSSAHNIALWIEAAASQMWTVLCYFPHVRTVEDCRELGLQAFQRVEEQRRLQRG